MGTGRARPPSPVHPLTLAQGTPARAGDVDMTPVTLMSIFHAGAQSIVADIGVGWPSSQLDLPEHPGQVQKPGPKFRCMQHRNACGPGTGQPEIPAQAAKHAAAPPQGSRLNHGTHEAHTAGETPGPRWFHVMSSSAWPAIAPYGRCLPGPLAPRPRSALA